jgi:aspartate aminotransferase-like enzyme
MKKYSFVPNREYRDRIVINYSHRSETFREIYQECKKELRKKFNITDNYEILFVNGSATAAIETIFSSLSIENVNILSNGEFGDRLNEIACRYLPTHPNSKYITYCQFETSSSIYNEYNFDDKICIVDCVSGFGYYDLPEADIIITSSSKILGGLPVLGIVIIKKEYEDKLQGKAFYLSLQRIWAYDKKGETPHTSLIPQYISLLKSLKKFDKEKMVKRVNRNCFMLRNFLEDNVVFVNTYIAPVVTLQFPNKVICQKVVNAIQNNNMEVYVNPGYMNDGKIQIATYNYGINAYKKLGEVILCAL